MRASTNEFQAYLAPDESLIDAGSGALVTDSYRTEGSIGVTDRRLLFVSDDGGYVDVTQAGISWIRSQPRTTFTQQGIRYRGMTVAGALLALIAFLAAVVLTASVLGAVLVAASVGTFVLAEHVRRTGGDVVWTALEEADERLPDGLEGLPRPERLDGIEDLDGVRQRTDGEGGESGQDDQLLVLGLGCFALAALIGPVALTGSLVVLPLALLTLCGLAVTDYAYRHERDLNAVGGSQRHEREVNVHLVGGSIVRLRIDSAERIDHALSRVVAGRSSEAPGTASHRA